MEFKKNRQHVILESHKKLKAPEDLTSVTLPAFLASSDEGKGIEREAEGIKKHVGALRTRLTDILKDPSLDRVYATAERLFRHESGLNLTSNNALIRDIEARASDRFERGAPPRKSDDTTIGDEINWEWTIYCATQSQKNVAIVSRDLDYGVVVNNEPILNDWLREEFRTRVPNDRKVHLTNRLSAALKFAEIPVSAQEEKAEEQAIADRAASNQTLLAGPLGVSDLLLVELLKRQRDVDPERDALFRRLLRQSFLEKMTPPKEVDPS